MITIVGSFKAGCGGASKAFVKEERQAFLRSLFGPNAYFYGTFNVGGINAKVERGRIGAMSPAYSGTDVHGVFWKFYPCTVSNGDTSSPAWVLIWEGTKAPYLELMSRQKLPDVFRNGPLRVTVYDKWSKKEVEEWVPTQYWFQTFPWSPKKADSRMVWDTIAPLTQWKDQRVLDIGGHTGYFSLQAARAGAHATLFEPDSSVMNRAETILRHIECSDVATTLTDPGGNWDIILYLSVHHQPDPEYKQLAKKLEELRSRCKRLFLELIVPSLKGSMSKDNIHRIVGATPVKEYKHKVRKVREIYSLKGDLND